MKHIAAVLLFALPLWAANERVTFEERYALAEDRAAALAELIPGTDDFYFYHALDAQNTAQLKSARDFLDKWMAKYPRGDWPHDERQRYDGLFNRQKILELNPANPGETMEWMRRELGLDLSALPPEEAAKAELHPNAIDPAQITFDAFVARYLERYSHTDFANFPVKALAHLVTRPLTPRQRQTFLKRIESPNLPNLVTLIAQDLAENRNVSFGEYSIHKRLTRAQLDELRKLRPEIAETRAFVDAYIARLQPSPDALLAPDSQAKLDYLGQIRAFVDTLSSKFNAVKIPLYRHYLETALALEKPDLKAFQTYLAMPRSPVVYVSISCRETWQDSGLATTPLSTQLSFQPSIFPPLPPADVDLVNAYLLHFLKDARDTSLFEKWIEPTILNQRIAESKLLYAQADAATWSSKLSPEALQALKDRTEILFPARHKTLFASNEIPALKLELKNIERLTMKVYDIDAAAFYRGNDREIDTDIDLDGLKPNAERTFTYKTPPLQRHTEIITLDELKQPGVYMVELIGNGIASRALIRKGQLRVAHRVTAAGSLFYLFDETGKHVQNATLSLGSQSYAMNDKAGGILLPCTTEESQIKTLVFESGRVALRYPYNVLPERYELQLGILFDNEMMLPGQSATVVLNPRLFANATPADIGLIDNASLTIASTSVDNITTTHTVNDLKLSNAADLTHTFQIPPRTQSVSFTLAGTVKNLSLNTDTPLTKTVFKTFNKTLASDQSAGFILRRAEQGYYLELRGRNGEPVNGNTHIMLTHRLFPDDPFETICLAKNGTVFLGPLKDINTVTAHYPYTDEHRDAAKAINNPDDFTYGYNGREIAQTWSLESSSELTRYTDLVVPAASDVTLPRHGALPDVPVYLSYALFALAGDRKTLSADETARITLTPDALTISKLPAGEYQLLDKATGASLIISSIDAPRVATPDGMRYLFTPTRLVEISPAETLRIANISRDDKALTITLSRSADMTRVHVLARRVQDGSENLWRDYVSERWSPRGCSAFDSAPLFSSYIAGRMMGDEARYIMERRYLPPQIGVMLDRPSLLLAPWSTAETTTDVIDAATGGEWVGSAPLGLARSGGSKGRLLGKYSGPADAQYGNPLPLDFLAKPALVLPNLKPANNVITIPMEQLADYTELCVIAADATSYDYQTLALPYAPLQTQDLRFTPAFEPNDIVTQQRTITTLAELKIPEDSKVTALETFESLDRVFAYFQALRNDPVFAKFDFLTRWQSLDAATKRAKYNEFACHELNVFVYLKDRAFFDAVVKPFLANKRDKQLVDDFLLGNNLTPYTEPLKFQQLNTFETILLARAGGTPIPPATLVRDIADAVALTHPDEAAWERAFNTAINASAYQAKPPARAVGNLFALPESPKPMKSAAAAPPEAQKEMRQESLPLGELEDFAFDEAADADVLLESDSSLREAINRPLYRSPGVTREWVETHYYQVPLARINAALITPSPFWRDVSQHTPPAPFLPASLADAARSTTERLLALALIDLPFAAPAKDDKQNAIVFAEYTAPARSADPQNAAPLLIVQSLFDAYDRYERNPESNQQIEKNLGQADEFFTARVYGMSVILSNPTSRPRKLQLLALIPEGAIPLNASRELLAQPVNINAFSIDRRDLFFYFPQPGDFPVHPASAAENGLVTAVAQPFTCHVRKVPSDIKLTTWQQLARNGSLQQILDFLAAQNLHDPQLDFELVKFRLTNKEFYTGLSAFLEARLVFDPTVAAFAFRHNDLPGVARYLIRFTPDFMQTLGPRFTSPLVSYDAEIARDFEHKEYWPLVNARVHPLKQQRTIPNQNFAAHYASLMRYLAFTPQRSDHDTMTLVCALLLQDRVSEAQKLLATIDAKKLPTSLQYDYANAYLHYAGSQLPAARALAAPYADYPVARWRNHFATLLAHIDEATGKPGSNPDPENLAQSLHLLAGATPSIAASLANTTLTLRPASVTQIQIRYYPLDIENLFSRAPFLASNPGALGHIRPAQTLTLNANNNVPLTHTIPADLAAQNLLIEITAPNTPVVQRLSYTPNTMTLHLLEPYGQLRVKTEKDDAPLPGAYVKVYAQDARGNITFYKDGYTDPRGAFDYASLSTDSLRSTQRFALLILHPTHGALLAEATPPPR